VRQLIWVHFPIWIVDVDVAVDVDERGNCARKRPKSRRCVSNTKLRLDLRSSMRISALSSSSLPLLGLSPNSQAATHRFLTNSGARHSLFR